MQKIVTLPQVELNLENAPVIEIPVAVGDQVAEETTLMVIETQKATVDVPCGASGYLRALLVKVGDEVNVHQRLAVLTDSPSETYTLPDPAADSAEPSPSPTSTPGQPGDPDSGGGKVRALPAARKRAKDLGVDLLAVKGSGAQQRITVEDVEAHARGLAHGNAESKPISGQRMALIAQMEKGHREIPQISISRFIDVTGIGTSREGTTFTSRLIVHLARSLKDHPALRSVLEGGRMHAGPVDVAVAMDTPGGLVAPVVRRADEKTLDTLSRELLDLRKRAADNRLSSDHLKDGRFALTNLGMLGVDLFTPLVFAGQTSVLAVGRAKEGAAWFTLAVDHRIVDGADAAKFLETLQSSIKGS